MKRIVRTTVARVALCIAVILTIVSSPASAQSPTPPWYMYNTYPNTNAFPPPAPSEPAGANAVVVEGLGSLRCNFGEAQIEYLTFLWAYFHYQVVLEISPQSACGSIAEYKGLLDRIASYVVQYTPDSGRWWAGFMLDEEPGFLFSASQLQDLNSHAAALMAGTPGMSWFFTENQPNGWPVATYNAILGNSWPAPQVYTTSMAGAVNSACSLYGKCTNLVTINAGYANPWNNFNYVTGLVSGTPWSNSYWGSGYWTNYWKVS